MLRVSLSNIMLIFFSVEEIEGVSLPKKKKKCPRRVSEDQFFSMGLYSLAV